MRWEVGRLPRQAKWRGSKIVAAAHKKYWGYADSEDEYDDDYYEDDEGQDGEGSEEEEEKEYQEPEFQCGIGIRVRVRPGRATNSVTVLGRAAERKLIGLHYIG